MTQRTRLAQLTAERVRGNADFIRRLVAAGCPRTTTTTQPSAATCLGLPVTILGTDRNDTIVGTEGPDVIDGGDGYDRLDGGNDDVVVDGDASQDTLIGGHGEDTLRGGDDNDTLDGGSLDDFLSGGDGRDRISGGLGDDRLDGGADNDDLRGEGNDDLITGGPGNDLLDGGFGSDGPAGWNRQRLPDRRSRRRSAGRQRRSGHLSHRRPLRRHGDRLRRLRPRLTPVTGLWPAPPGRG